MALPTLEKTWQFAVNQVVTATGSTLNDRRKALYNIKAAMTGFANNPWVVVMSSDGESAGSGDKWIDKDGYAYITRKDTGEILKSGRILAYAKTTPTDCRSIPVRLPDGSMSTIYSDRLLGFRRHLTSDLTIAPLI